MVERLLEAKAAVDAMSRSGRGLGGGLGGKRHETRDAVVCDGMKMLMVQVFCGFCFHFLRKVRQCANTFAPTFSFVLCDHDCVVAYTSICFLEIG